MTTYKRIKAVELTMDILKYLADQKKPVSAKDIADALGEAYGRVVCHLATLEDGGFTKRVGESWELGMFLAVAWASVTRSREAAYQQARSDLELLKVS